jgi:hypothetical protein
VKHLFLHYQDTKARASYARAFVRLGVSMVLADESRLANRTELWDDVCMAKPPILEITYDASDRPTSAKCSVCSTELLLGNPEELATQDSLKWTRVNFDVHVSQKHSSRADFRRGAKKGPVTGKSSSVAEFVA